MTVAARSNADIAEKKGLDFRSEKYGDSTVKFHKGEPWVGTEEVWMS